MVTADEQLGTFIQRYETDNHRRGVRALVTGIVGVLVTGLGIGMYALVLPSMLDGSLVGGAAVVPAAVLGVGVVSLMAAIVHGKRFFTRAQESFSVYQYGLVHAHSGQTRVIRWDEIAKVVTRDNDKPAARALAGDLSCTITVKNGSRVVITGFTDRADRLADSVEAATAHHAPHTNPS